MQQQKPSTAKSRQINEILEKDKERLSYKHKKKIYARLLRGATIELWKTFQQKL